MKKAQTLFIGAGVVAIMAVIGGAYLCHNHFNRAQQTHTYPTTQFGAFLAAQHAIYVNDFDSAANFAGKLTDVEYATVQSTKFLSEFLSGHMPDEIIVLEEEKNTASRLIYDAYLVQNDKWDEMYSRHKKDTSALAAPLRIWSGIATNHITKTLEFIRELPTNESWQHFVSGQIYAETGKIDRAAEEFANVSTDFLNINDYMYLMSFYQHHDLMDDAERLHNDFTARPGGMYMLDYNNIPDWSMFSGYKNQLAFSLVQTVSHTQIMMYSDLAILLLRFAQITSPLFGQTSDAVNYYLGQFFYNNTGNYRSFFDKIPVDSPFYLFAVLRDAERSGDIKTLERATEQNPLFVPAVNKLIAYNIQNNDKRGALRVVNAALDDENLNELGHAFFVKSRAHIYYMFEDFESAQTDLHDASETLPLDGEILALQAKIWAAQGRNIEDAYDYAMTLVRQDPTDIMAWDTLGRVVTVREGAQPALDVIARVGEISNSCSSLFEQLGDLYVALGDEKLALDAYQRAIDLSDDGLVIIKKVEKKIRNLK